ncbi:unnamed protein product [Sphenostylis stenocarpa]|uniref:Uncharacterized protein n=1 Tax=Sphenostylis stenocarpa TaxID=92480 RepID=A0AA86SN12_9FABA|nr:unnamed protein product [Sphenostylis stenocarpa]
MSWEGAAKWVVGINEFFSSTRYRRRHEKYDTKKRCNTRTSQEVTHPSTTLAQARLTAEFDGIRCISAWYDRTRQVLRDQWGRRSGLLGSTVKRMMFVHARLMKFDRVLLIDRYRLTSRKIRHEKEVQHEDFPGGHPS